MTGLTPTFFTMQYFTVSIQFKHKLSLSFYDISCINMQRLPRWPLKNTHSCCEFWCIRAAYLLHIHKFPPSFWTSHKDSRVKKNPRNTRFLRFCMHFLVPNDYLFVNRNYRLLNCGARRAALRPYFTKPKLNFAWFYAVFQAFCSSSTSS